MGKLIAHVGHSSFVYIVWPLWFWHPKRCKMPRCHGCACDLLVRVRNLWAQATKSSWSVTSGSMLGSYQLGPSDCAHYADSDSVRCAFNRTCRASLPGLDWLHNRARLCNVNTRITIMLPFTWLVTLMPCDLSLRLRVMVVRLQFGTAVFVERACECAEG